MRKKLPPLNALRSFEAAARHLSFKEAAQELCVSLSAVSHQIKLLEGSLGVELFTRKARSVELTKVGQFYYPILREAFDKIADGTETLLAPQQSDVLTVQLYNTFAIRWLVPRLAEFQNRYPDINIRLSTSQKDVDFSHEDVDACVMVGSQSDPNLNYTFLFSYEIFPVCSPSLLTSASPLSTPEDLARHTILQVYPSSKDWYIWLNGVGVDGINPENGLQFDSYDHALATATQGIGVALGMQPYVSRDLASGLLVEAFPGKRIRHQDDWYFVCREDKAKQQKIITFRNWLLEHVNKDNDITAIT